MHETDEALHPGSTPGGRGPRRSVRVEHRRLDHRPVLTRAVRASAAALALLLSAAWAHGDDELFTQYEADGWLVLAYEAADNGRFSRCAIAHRDPGRARFALDAGYGLEVRLEAPEAEGEQPSAAELIVDGRSIGSFPTVPAHRAVWIQVGRRADVYARLLSATALQMRSPTRRIDASLVGVGRGLARLVECVDMARSFARGPDNPYLPGNEPVYPSARRRRPADDPFGTREKIRALLTASGLRDVAFVPGETLGAREAALAWTSDRVIGLALLEARKERSAAELQKGFLQRFASRCVSRPESRTPTPRTIGGYTLVQATFACESASDTRVTVTTSILDDTEVVTLLHAGLATEAQRLEATNRALGNVLAVLLKQ